MVRRLYSVVRVSWSSSIAFATVGTAIVTLLVLPLLSIAFTVLLGADVHAPDLARTGYAAALVAWMLAIAAGIVSAVASDRMLGIYAFVHQFRLLDPAYWLGKAVVPTLLSVVTGIASIGVVAVLSGGGAMFARTCLLAGVAIFLGIVLGIAGAGIGVALPDPYLATTVLGTFLPVLTGVIVPLDAGPAWLRVVSYAVPGSGLADSVAGLRPLGLARDCVLALGLAAIGLMMTWHALARLRQGHHFDTL